MTRGAQDGASALTAEPAAAARYDAFISYRRVDGEAVAMWLRRQLRSYRLPRALAAERAPLQVYLDTTYGRATDDYWERNIGPALARSAYLIVIATPACLDPGHDGAPNWVVREIGAYEDPMRILVARGLGDLTGPLPSAVLAARPRQHVVDLRAARRWWTRWWRAAALRHELVSIVAALHEITPTQMPVLRQEEQRRQHRRRAIAVLVVGAMVAGALVAGHTIRQSDAIAQANALATRGQAVLSEDPTAAYELARRADAIATTAETRRLLVESYDRAPLYHPVLRGDQPIRALAEFGTPARIVVGDFGGTPHLIAAGGTIGALPAHGDVVSAIAVSPSGRQLATASWDGVVRVQPLSGAPIELRDDHAVYDALFVGDTTVLTAAKDGAVRRWSLTSQGAEVVRRFARPVISLDASLDGRVVLALSGDGATVFGPAARDPGATFPAEAARLCPDGSCVVVANLGVVTRFARRADGTWDEGADFGVYEGPIDVLRIAPDGQRIAAGGDGKVIYIWDLRLGLVGRLVGHANSVRALAWSADGTSLVSGGDDATVRVWRLDAGRRVELATATDMLPMVEVSPSGALAVSNGDDAPKLWTIAGATAIPLADGPPEADAAAFSPDDAQVVTATRGGSVLLWNRNGARRALLGKSLGAVRSAAFSADGRIIAVGSQRGVVSRWTRDGAALPAIEPGRGGVSAVALNRDGSLVLTVHSGFALWSADGAQRCHQDFGADGDSAITRGAMTADGRRIVTSYYGEAVARVWDAQCRPGAVLRGHGQEITAVAFSTRGDRIATVSTDRTVRVWTSDGRELYRFDLPGPGLSVRFVADDRYVIAATTAGLVERITIDVDLARAGGR